MMCPRHKIGSLLCMEIGCIVGKQNTFNTMQPDYQHSQVLLQEPK